MTRLLSRSYNPLPMTARRILVVDDEPGICEVLSIALRKDGYDVTAEPNPRQALERFRTAPFDVVLQDIRMPEMDGIDLLREIKKVRDDAIVIVLTAYSTWDRAVEAMRLGAFDYIKKPFDTNHDIRASVKRAARFLDDGKQLSKSTDEMLQRIGHLTGASPAVRTVRDLIRRAAPTDSTVLIAGESGVGKELVARAIHHGSARSGKPFVAVNCAALTETLLESELFGHSRGSFTGAVTEKVGLVEVAHTGSLFLDEISEMSPQLQVKVLRLLEEKEFKPVGSNQTRHADVRFVAATNKELAVEVKEGHFRKDLFYRLNVIPIAIPPLRDRQEDIALLAGAFLRRFSVEMGKDVRRLSSRAQEALKRYAWPGNVRELENCIQRAVALCEGEEIEDHDLFDSVKPASETKVVARHELVPEEGVDLERTLEEIEKSYLLRALELSGGSYTKAAQLLRMSLRSFRYKLQKYGLDRG